jgi:flagellar biosynthesis GTPase FlhF
MDVQLEAEPAPDAAAAAPASGLDFRHAFMAAQAPAPVAAAIMSPPPADTASPAELAQVQAQAQARDTQRGRELVDLVRDEIAALRREFRLSQQSSAWQGGLQLHPALAPLVQALNDNHVPTALRTLLLDGLQGLSDPQQALRTWRSQLEHSLAGPQASVPSQGVHVLAGPSGGGKTLMCARLARHASSLHGAEQVAIISYRDQRAGAWSQTQMLGAQLGVECFRAGDEESLRLLLSELGPRALVLIDTPGVQMAERLAEIKAQAPQAGLHAVIPADASSVTLRRVLADAQVGWQSLMLSKLDEASAPWPVLQHLSNNQVPFSSASDGSRMTDLIHAFTLPQLVDLALAPLARALEATELATPLATPAGEQQAASVGYAQAAA